MNQNKLKRLARPKVPRKTDNNNYIGIELEFLSPYDEDYLLNALVSLDLHNVAHLGFDSSVSSHLESHRQEYECRFMFKEIELDKYLSLIQTFIYIIDAKYNNSCGLHVHLDMRNRYKELCFDRLYNSAELLFNMVPSYRKNNHFCVFPIPDYELRNKDLWDALKRAYSINRYTAINNTNRHTIEVRCHEMTDDMSELFNWIMLLLNIINDQAPNQTYIRQRSRKVKVDYGIIASSF